MGRGKMVVKLRIELRERVGEREEKGTLSPNKGRT